MAKNKKRKRGHQATSEPAGIVHIARQNRPHLAEELMESGQHGAAESLCRGLRDPFKSELLDPARKMFSGKA